MRQTLCNCEALDEPTGKAIFLKPAMERLAEEHLQAKGLHHALPGISQVDHEAARLYLRKVLKLSPHRQVQGDACLFLAAALHARPRPDEAEVTRLLERCSGEFKDVRFKDVPLPELAAPLLFRIRHLSVGKPAPEIVGTDAEGRTFKLSDFRGRVVLLDFFADWCPYCVRMYPEEGALVKKYAARPFALLGVNGDSLDTLQQLAEQKKVTWRCWADGRGTDRPELAG